MRKLNDLNHSYVDEEIIDAIYKAALVLTIKATKEHAKAIWLAMKDKVVRHYGYTELSDVLAAIDNGSCGKYGTFKTLNGITVIDWIKERRKEMETFKPSRESQQIEIEKMNRIQCDPDYPRAVLMRMKFDPGGKTDFYSLDEIVQGIKEGLNVFMNRNHIPSDFEPIILKQKIKL
jgi:hypothetical protein